MKHIPLLPCIVVCALGLWACGEDDAHVIDAPSGAESGDEARSADLKTMQLDPRVVLVGLSDVYDALEVTHLSFEADLFVLPADAGDELDGDAVAIRFDFTNGKATTQVPQGSLRLGEPGTYRVLVRVRPTDDAAAVTVAGAYTRPEGLEAREKGADEPAPSPAEPAPSPADEADEPAPSPAEPAPSPADEADEPAPSPAEPAPSPADEADEPAPSPAEPAPSPADEADEPAPSPARAKGDATGFDPGATRPEGQPLQVRSSLSYEFYAGDVEVAEGDRELVVTWDVRAWLRALLAEPLGIEVPAEADVAEAPPTPGFADRPDDFNVETR